MIANDQFQQWLENPVTLKFFERLKIQIGRLQEARLSYIDALCSTDPTVNAKARQQVAAFQANIAMLQSLIDIDYDTVMDNAPKKETTEENPHGDA